MLPGVSFAQGPYDCVAGADALAIITEWEVFRALDLARVKASMREPIVVDLRNIYRRDDMRELGFTYDSVGRAARRPGAAPPGSRRAK
jgi:UDPglucose 6-dehydrogenase